MATLTGLGNEWRSSRLPARLTAWPAALAWWLLGLAAGVPVLEAAARYPAHVVLSVAGALVVMGAALVVLRNPAWGACALIVIVYWNLSDVVTDTWGFGWVLRLALAGVAAAGALDVLISEPRRGRWPVLAAMLVYGIAQALATPGAMDPAVAHAALIEYGKALVVFYLVTNLLRTPRALRWGVNAVLLGVVLLGAPVIYQGVTGTSSQLWGFGSRFYKEIVPGQFGWRLGGAMGDPNFLAMVLVAALPLALMQVIERGASRWRRAGALTAAAVALGATLYTYSRASLIGVALVALVLMVRHPRRRWVLAGTAAALLAAVVVMPQSFFSRLATLTEFGQVRRLQLPDSSFQVRLNADYSGTLMFLQHPLLGVGPGNYPDNYQHYSALAGLAIDPTMRDPHNLYIQIASETGLAGLASFAFLMWASFALMERGRRRLRRLRAENFADLIWALELALATYLVLSMFLHGAYFRHFLLLLALGTLGGTMALDGAASDGAPGTRAPRSGQLHSGG